MDKTEASNQLNYEIGVFMFRAINEKTEKESDYDVHNNFNGIIEELNEHFIFNKSTVLCGFENEWQNVYGDYNKDVILDLFSEANNTYEINYED